MVSSFERSCLPKRDPQGSRNRLRACERPRQGSCRHAPDRRSRPRSLECVAWPSFTCACTPSFPSSTAPLASTRRSAAAAADGQPALAITDLSNLFGAVKFYKAARGAGVKPIIGAEVCLEARARRDGSRAAHGAAGAEPRRAT